MRNAQEPELTDQMEQVDFVSCHMIDMEKSRRFLSSKKNSKDEGVKENASELKEENLLHH